MQLVEGINLGAKKKRKEKKDKSEDLKKKLELEEVWYYLYKFFF